MYRDAKGWEMKLTSKLTFYKRDKKNTTNISVSGKSWVCSGDERLYNDYTETSLCQRVSKHLKWTRAYILTHHIPNTKHSKSTHYSKKQFPFSEPIPVYAWFFQSSWCPLFVLFINAGVKLLSSFAKQISWIMKAVNDCRRSCKSLCVYQIYLLHTTLTQINKREIKSLTASLK